MKKQINKVPKLYNSHKVRRNMGAGKELPRLLPDKSVYQLSLEGFDDQPMLKHYGLTTKVCCILPVTVVTLRWLWGLRCFD